MIRKGAYISRIRKQAFTLMELVIVMLILAILAIAAAPRFISVQDEAYEAVRKGLVQDIGSALDMGAVKAALENMQKGPLQIEGSDYVCIRNGYPSINTHLQDDDDYLAKCFNLFILFAPLPDDLKVVKVNKKAVSYQKDKMYSLGKNFKTTSYTSLELQVGPKDSCIIKIEQKTNLGKPVVTAQGSCE